MNQSDRHIRSVLLALPGDASLSQRTLACRIGVALGTANNLIRLLVNHDRIEVYSPGPLPPGVSLEKMRRLEPQSVLRNPIIVGVFRDLGSRYIERLGTGIRRMALAMEGHGLPRPQFEEVGSEFRVTVIGPGERFMEEVAV